MGLRGLIAKILSFTHTTTNGAVISDVKGDPGGGANLTAQNFQPAGDDASPLPDDYALFVPGEREGKVMAAGYVDPVNARVSGPGEKRIYARNSLGIPVAEIHIKSTGEITAFNALGSITISPLGEIKSTNLLGSHTIFPDGTIRATNLIGSHTILSDGTIRAANLIGSQTILPNGTITTANALSSHVMLPDGTVTTINALGSHVMLPIGTHIFNGLVTIDVSGTLTAPKIVATDSLIIDGLEVKEHDHPAGTPPGDTGAGPQTP